MEITEMETAEPNSNNGKRQINHYEIQCMEETAEGYPEKLKVMANRPSVLYCLGNLPDPTKPAVAIVGARMCSPYGRIQAFRYARYLSDAGVQVISGLASGIDAEAHKGALEGTTATFAVLGSGVDVCYPAANRPLYRRILRNGGGILSEFEPGTKARSYHFPIRNRIISGLSDLVLVVEAKEKSGSLITARYALEQGINVYAIPGIVTDELSVGCNKLIFDGAGIAYTPEVLLSELGIDPEKKNHTVENVCEKNHFLLESDLKLVYSCLDLRPKTPDLLMEETGLQAEVLHHCLTELILLGLAKEAVRHYYVRTGS